MLRNLWSGILRNFCLLGVVFAASSGAVVAQAKELSQYYYLNADAFSLDANRSLTAYRAYGHLSGTPGANLGCAMPDTRINIALLVASDRFYAEVTLNRLSSSNENKTKPTETKQRIDLTNLRPVAIDLGAGKEGRIYQLNLVPTIKSLPIKAKSFREAADDLYQLKFHASRVTLNDKQYIGNMLASDADFFSMEICGVASVEFSLRHLKDAVPWGKLSDGQITITNPDGTSIAISNVTNGSDDRIISGGPYTVWVRWKKPQSSVEEYRASLKAHRDELKEEPGTPAAHDTKSATIAIIDRQLAREPGPWITGCGAGDVQKSELIGDQ